MNYRKDSEYFLIVKDILENEEFNKLKNIEHHGTTRFNHSLKVSYNAYKLAKKLHLNYKDVARAGLLHDFFLSEIGRSKKERVISTFTHPKKASKNAEMFGINEREKNIIEAHMFPFCLTLPKYMESWTVVLNDKAIGLAEFMTNFAKPIKYATNVLILVIFGIIK